ncbi:hypothetical protein [Polymorphobacter megasporae]|uniref:hypothetical protein n=1 Tax=Glacieibacterium megasporae TaxID=2835787 RepID=UPI001CAA4BC4|nr:hypothetical protein [Polymorphobacter megasporae]UAJ10659.1 hypothetical protein KTC28_02585 [Polymorphobacter megasporae]
MFDYNLRAIGATHVISSRDADFRAQLVAACTETGATIAFDATAEAALAATSAARWRRRRWRG